VRKYVKPLERRQWVNAKHRYLHSDITYAELAKDMGIGRQGLMSGLSREFPNIDWKARKKEERDKRETKKIADIKERGDIKRVKLNMDLDATDDKHLDLINLLLDQALQECEEGTLKAKSIKDIIQLMDMHRAISHKRTTKDRVITIRAEKPEDFEALPEIIDGEFEEIASSEDEAK